MLVKAFGWLWLWPPRQHRIAKASNADHNKKGEMGGPLCSSSFPIPRRWHCILSVSGGVLARQASFVYQSPTRACFPPTSPNNLPPRSQGDVAGVSQVRKRRRGVACRQALGPNLQTDT